MFFCLPTQEACHANVPPRNMEKCCTNIFSIRGSVLQVRTPNTLQKGFHVTNQVSKFCLNDGLSITSPHAIKSLNSTTSQALTQRRGRERQGQPLYDFAIPPTFP